MGNNEMVPDQKKKNYALYLIYKYLLLLIIYHPFGIEPSQKMPRTTKTEILTQMTLTL